MVWYASSVNTVSSFMAQCNASVWSLAEAESASLWFTEDDDTWGTIQQKLTFPKGSQVNGEYELLRV